VLCIADRIFRAEISGILQGYLPAGVLRSDAAVRRKSHALATTAGDLAVTGGAGDNAVGGGGAKCEVTPSSSRGAVRRVR
jgi:hypothetical protein